MAFGALTALVACSSDETTPTTTTTPSGDTVTVRVSAATGGTVADKDDKASLAIPAGALAADTDITLKVAPAENGSAGPVYDFGPDGLQFLKPATLTLKGDGVTVPDGKTAAVAIFEGGAFKKVEGSAFAAGVATAPIMHFTKYTIIVVDGVLVLQPPANCVEAFATFKACGGSPVGAWKVKDFCIDAKLFEAQKPVGCADYVATVDASTTQTFTFTGTDSAGTIDIAAGKSTIIITADFPPSCISDAGQVDCTQLSKTDTVCTTGAGGKCHCVQTQVKDEPAKQGVYPNADPTKNSPVCVNTTVTPNIMTIQDTKDSAPTGILFVFEKL
jgi:hypothetical protein